MWSSAVGCLVTLTRGLLAAPLIATAQPQGKLPLVGVLEPSRQQPPSRCLPAFQQSLRDLGYVEGHTIRLAYRYGEDHADRLPPPRRRAGPTRAGRHLAALGPGRGGGQAGHHDHSLCDCRGV